jgi:hypothetical protein
MILTSHLQHSRPFSDGRIVAQCPACAEAGHDKSGNHLTIWPSGKWSCCVNPRDKAHNRRIFELCGDKTVIRRAYSPPPAPRPPVIDAHAIWHRWHVETRREAVKSLAVKLGVSEGSLDALGAAWAGEHKAWAFPMRNSLGQIVGIRLRSEDGAKWAVTGSRAGIFIPEKLPPQDIVWIPEGPTDVLAALSIGLYAVGRPSCNTGGAEIAALCRRLGIHRMVMVSDNDTPGLEGAKKVAKEVGLRHVIFLPPCKDLREYVKLGGTRQFIENSINNLVWTK